MLKFIDISSERLTSAGLAPEAVNELRDYFGDQDIMIWTPAVQETLIRSTHPARGLLGHCWVDGVLPRIPMIGISFAGADLRKAFLLTGDFRYCDFRGANLKDVCLQDADLRGALFDKIAGSYQSTGIFCNSRRNPHDAPVRGLRLVDGVLKW